MSIKAKYILLSCLVCVVLLVDLITKAVFGDTEIFNVPVEVEVSFINNDNAVFKTETLIDTISDAENNLRTRTTDYDIIRIDAVVKVQDEVKELSTFVKR